MMMMMMMIIRITITLGLQNKKGPNAVNSKTHQEPTSQANSILLLSSHLTTLSSVLMSSFHHLLGLLGGPFPINLLIDAA
jgi:hypothetical protein